MSLKEWQLAERYSGLGGSDAAAAVGLSPYQTALELYLEKRERRPYGPGETESQLWGSLLEPVIRQRYCDLTRHTVRVPPKLTHEQYRWMFAHVDGITDDNRLFEAKTARIGEGWGLSGSDEIPHGYLLQVQHCLAVARLEVCDVAVLIGGSDYRQYEIPADAELQEMLIDGEADFWRGVETGVPPEPEWEAPDIARMIARLYPGSNGKRMKATKELSQLREDWKVATERIHAFEQIADMAKARILFAMGESAVMTFPDGFELRRHQIKRKAYMVPATQFLQTRFVKTHEDRE